MPDCVIEDDHRAAFSATYDFAIRVVVLAILKYGPAATALTSSYAAAGADLLKLVIHRIGVTLRDHLSRSVLAKRASVLLLGGWSAILP